MKPNGTPEDSGIQGCNLYKTSDPVYMFIKFSRPLTERNRIKIRISRFFSDS